jgi:four helix bundle protein
LQRAVVSIASNIAEGKERETIPELIRYLYIAKGSSGELKTQFIIAQRIGAVDEERTKNLIRRVEEISAMLGALIRTLKRK